MMSITGNFTTVSDMGHQYLVDKTHNHRIHGKTGKPNLAVNSLGLTSHNNKFDTLEIARCKLEEICLEKSLDIKDYCIQSLKKQAVTDTDGQRKTVFHIYPINNDYILVTNCVKGITPLTHSHARLFDDEPTIYYIYR